MTPTEREHTHKPLVVKTSGRLTARATCTAHYWSCLAWTPRGWVVVDDPKPARGRLLKVVGR